MFDISCVHFCFESIFDWLFTLPKSNDVVFIENHKLWAFSMSICECVVYISSLYPLLPSPHAHKNKEKKCMSNAAKMKKNALK